MTLTGNIVSLCILTLRCKLSELILPSSVIATRVAFRKQLPPQDGYKATVKDPPRSPYNREENEVPPPRDRFRWCLTIALKTISITIFKAFLTAFSGTLSLQP